MAGRKLMFERVTNNIELKSNTSGLRRLRLNTVGVFEDRIQN